MLMSLVELQPGAIVQAHSHPHEQMGMVLEGRLVSLSGIWRSCRGRGICTSFRGEWYTRWLPWIVS